MSVSAQEVDWEIRGQCAREHIAVMDRVEYLRRASRYIERRPYIVAGRLASAEDLRLLERYGK